MPNDQQGLSGRRLFDAVSAAGVAMPATAAANAEPAPQDEAPPMEPLANFKYNIESRNGWQGDRGSAKEATVEPGGMQEVHWHPPADEWLFSVGGRARIGLFGSHSLTKVDEFGPNDAGFIQRGFGHYIEQLGDEPTEIIILGNSPVFEAVSLLAKRDMGIIAKKALVGRPGGLPH